MAIDRMVERHGFSAWRRVTFNGLASDGALGAERADAAGAGEEDFVVGQQPVEVVEGAVRRVDHLLDAAREVGGHVLAQAAHAVVVVEHALAADVLEEVVELLAQREGVHEWGGGAGVGAERAVEHAVRGDAAPLAHDQPHVLGALGHLDAGELLERQHVGVLVQEG
jgi:hypothetical protein